VEQVENRVSGTVDKVGELDQTVKDKKIWMEHKRYPGNHEKIKPMNCGCRRRRENTN
jgi:hypothetical protein